MTGHTPRPKEVIFSMTMRGTTILAVRHRDRVVVAGDGQVTLDITILKHGARKVRRLYHNNVIVGFAGATADAFTLFERFDQKLEQYSGNLLRAAVELAKDWRTDRVLRHLEALMIAVSSDKSLIISGNGDVVESDDEVMAVGSERERGGAAEPRAARRRDAPRRLSALRQGVVALHAQQRAVPGYIFRFPGEVRTCSAMVLLNSG